jgi:hypothetical protein
MDTPLLIAIVTVSITILGWLINHILTARRDSASQRLSASLKYIERQLEELYGPLTFLIIEGRRASMDFVIANGREPVFGSMNADEVKLWRFWAEHDLLPRNEKIQQLLMTKTHLIDGDKIPPSFVTFLEHHNSWRMSHLRWKKEGVEYNWRSEIGWPAEFTDEVVNTFGILKANQDKITKQMQS